MSAESSSVKSLQNKINELDEINSINDVSSNNISDFLNDLSNLSIDQNDSHSFHIESDDHITDFLNENDDKNAASSTILSDDFSLNSNILQNSSHNSIIDSHETEASIFLTAFNAKYRKNAIQLFDVFDFIDSLIESKNVTETVKKEKKSMGIDYNEKIIKYQTENDKLQTQLEESHNKINTLEHQITTLKTTISALDNQNKSLQTDFNTLQNSLVNMTEILESQMNDIKTLSEQRSQLIETIKKQDCIIEKYDNLYKEKLINQEKNKENKKDINVKKQYDINDELYSLISKIIHEIDQIKDDSLRTEINKITNDSNLQIKERIISIFNNIKTKYETLFEANNNIINEINIKDKNIQNYKQKCIEILSLFEEELSFLQKLTHSTDLQSVLFCATTSNEIPLLDEHSKTELIKRCAQLGSFIEQTIGQISKENFEEQFPDNVDKSNIFEMIQSTQIEERVQNLFEKFDIENDINLRELFDMFCAQVYVNDLLKNYITELNMRIAHCGNEINLLRQRKDNNVIINDEEKQIPNKTISRLIKHMKHVDSKIRRFVAHYIEVNDDESTYKIVVDLFNLMSEELQKNSSAFQETEKMQNEIRRLKKALNKSKKKIIDSADNNELENKLNETTKELEMKIKEFENLQKQIEQMNNEIINYKKQIEESENKNKEYQESLNNSTEQINSLNKQINNFETAFESVKIQRKQLGDQIEKLQIANQKLNESIQQSNQQIREDYEKKINEIMEKMEKIKNENENYSQQNQILNSKNQQLLSEMSTLNITNKSIELKMRTLEERINLEKKHLQSKATAQATVIQAEQSQQINELKSKIGEIIKRLSKYFDEKQTINIDSIINAIEEELKNSKTSKENYIEMLEDVTNAKKLLGISPSSKTKIAEVINEILNKKENKQKLEGENLKRIQQEHKEYDRIKRELKKTESQIIALKQWENWARRIHRVINETDSLQLESNALRLSLEEALLASVSHRVLFFKTDLLRAQKIMFMKFDKRLLMCKQTQKNNVRAVIAVCLFARRLQTIAGCLPINIHPPEPIIRTNQTIRNEKESKRSLFTPAKHSQITGKKLLHPLIPFNS